MPKLSPIGIPILILQLVVLYTSAKIFGELLKKIGQPAVVGEILAGIIVGPTVLGAIFPSTFEWLFLSAKSASLALDGIVLIAIIFLLFIVGLEVDLPTIAKQGKSVILISILGLLIPATLGGLCGWLLYNVQSLSISRGVFALFMGAAMSISALPVIAKVLLDLNLLKTNIGCLIIAVAMINDIAGWLLFTIVLGVAGLSYEQPNVWLSVVVILLLASLSVTWLKRVFDGLLQRIHYLFRTEWAVIGAVVMLMLIASLVTEKVGGHALFGAFLVGIALSSSSFFTRKARKVIVFPTLHFFAPVFFATVGLKVNFLQNFNWMIVLVLLVIAYTGKILAAMIGGKFTHISPRESLVIGLGIAARGGMGIILATIAYDVKIINDSIFTGLIIMAVITSMTTGFIRNLLPSSYYSENERYIKNK